MAGEEDGASVRGAVFDEDAEKLIENDGSRPVVGSSRMRRRERWAMAVMSPDLVLLPSESLG